MSNSSNTHYITDLLANVAFPLNLARGPTDYSPSVQYEFRAMCQSGYKHGGYYDCPPEMMSPAAWGHSGFFGDHAL